MAVTAEELQPLFLRLQGQLESDAHDSAVETADQILAAAPGDADALHAKVVALIELGKAAEALQVLDSSAELVDEYVFERAYCLYTLNREADALALLMPGGASPGETRMMALAAQIKYRMGAAAESAELFLQAESAGGPTGELSTNILAAYVTAGKGKEALEYAATRLQAGGGEGGEGSGSAEGEQQFELYYNRACAAISVGDLAAAKRLLVRALALCRESLTADDYTEEEIEVELGVLTAQAAYVDQTRGDESAAKRAYDLLFSFKSELEPAVAAVAGNNMLQIRGATDFFDSWKKARANLSDGLTKKLTPRQRLAFLTNAALLSSHMHKPEQCREVLGTIEKEFPSSEAPALLRASLLLGKGKSGHKQCEEALEAAAASSTHPTAALLTLAQLQLQAAELPRALATLQRLTAIQATPGMVGTLVALHERNGDVAAAAACFDAVGASDAPLLRAAAAFFARHGRWRQAAKSQAALLEANPRDLAALAGLVIATSHFDSDLANAHYEKLGAFAPPAEDDVPMCDGAALEQAALPKASKGGAGALAGKRAAEGDEGDGRKERKRRKRTKKPRYPKGFDIANPSATPLPDPERWTPKRERSTYRQRKKDKRAGVSRGPQGSATGAAKVDARATTNIVALSDAEKAKAKADEDARARAEAAAAASAASGGKKKKGKGKKDRF